MLVNKGARICDMADVASVHRKGTPQLSSVNSFGQIFIFSFLMTEQKVAGAEFTRYCIPMPATPRLLRSGLLGQVSDSV